MAGCKKKFTEAGFDIVKDENFQFKEYLAHIKVYNAPVERVYSQNPKLLSLGIYNHPAFGLSKADLLLQFNNSNAFNSLNFDNADSILFVELRIPYFSKKNEKLSTEENPVYELDSVYGTQPFKINVYQSKYYLFPYDPSSNLVTPQMYYSDFDFRSHTGDLLAQEDEFYITSEYLVDTLETNGYSNFLDEDLQTDLPRDTLPPHLVVRLDTTFFKNRFFNKARMPVLTNNELFKNYFRGLYIEVEPLNDDGSFALFSSGKVQLVLAYRYLFKNQNGTPDDPTDDFFDHAYEKIVLTAITGVNIYKNDFYPAVKQSIIHSNTTSGEEKVYIKGEAGSMAVMELFTPEELYRLRNNNWLINQANIRFYVDENEMAGVDSLEFPSQLYLYKIKYNMPISDLSLKYDNGVNLDINDVLRVYNGRLTVDEDSGKRYYEFNVTRHIKDLLRKDSTNLRLGIRVSSNLAEFVPSYKLKKDPDICVPYGVVLKGNQAPTEAVELRIYYTEPESNN